MKNINASLCTSIIFCRRKICWIIVYYIYTFPSISPNAIPRTDFPRMTISPNAFSPKGQRPKNYFFFILLSIFSLYLIERHVLTDKFQIFDNPRKSKCRITFDGCSDAFVVLNPLLFWGCFYFSSHSQLKDSNFSVPLLFFELSEQ